MQLNSNGALYSSTTLPNNFLIGNTRLFLLTKDYRGIVINHQVILKALFLNGNSDVHMVKRLVNYMNAI